MTWPIEVGNPFYREGILYSVVFFGEAHLVTIFCFFDFIEGEPGIMMSICIKQNDYFSIL